MDGLQQDDVILGLEGEVLRQKSGQLQLNHELVVGGGHLDRKQVEVEMVRLVVISGDKGRLV